MSCAEMLALNQQPGEINCCVLIVLVLEKEVKKHFSALTLVRCDFFIDELRIKEEK